MSKASSEILSECVPVGEVDVVFRHSMERLDDALEVIGFQRIDVQERN